MRTARTDIFPIKFLEHFPEIILHAQMILQHGNKIHLTHMTVQTFAPGIIQCSEPG